MCNNTHSVQIISDIIAWSKNILKTEILLQANKDVCLCLSHMYVLISMGQNQNTVTDMCPVRNLGFSQW